MFISPEKIIEKLDFLPGQAVVDLGSGSGHYVLALAKELGPKSDIYGVDLNKDTLARLKNMADDQGYGNVHVVHGNVEEPLGSRLRDDIADWVIISNLLSQLADKKACIKEALRVLKTGGSVVVIDWSDKLPQEEARKLFESEKLSFQRELKAGEHHWATVFKK